MHVWKIHFITRIILINELLLLLLFILLYAKNISSVVNNVKGLYAKTAGRNIEMEVCNNIEQL